jgi:hypothetical protein
MILGLRPTRAAGDRPEAIMRGEGQESGVVDRLAVFVPGHDDLHVVVQAGGRGPAKVLEGPHVLAERGLQVLRCREVDVLPPGVAQHVAEKVHLGHRLPLPTPTAGNGHTARRSPPDAGRRIRRQPSSARSISTGERASSRPSLGTRSCSLPPRAKRESTGWQSGLAILGP